jgi:serine/threonine protein phosphatase 1
MLFVKQNAILIKNACNNFTAYLLIVAMRTLVIGDIHGALRALLQCLERARFDYKKDTLICLGDVTDGWPETKACITELKKIKHLVYILGNHDWWTREWMETGTADDNWLKQGGAATVASYAGRPYAPHLKFLQKAAPFFVADNRLFVHAGIDPHKPLQVDDWDTFLWDRALAKSALQAAAFGSRSKLTAFDEVFVGHTPVFTGKPTVGGGVWLMDTGAGWHGVLTLMDVHTKECFISDAVPTLYPGVVGRGNKKVA